MRRYTDSLTCAGQREGTFRRVVSWLTPIREEVDRISGSAHNMWEPSKRSKRNKESKSSSNVTVNNQHIQICTCAHVHKCKYQSQVSHVTATREQINSSITSDHTDKHTHNQQSRSRNDSISISFQFMVYVSKSLKLLVYHLGVYILE